MAIGTGSAMPLASMMTWDGGCSRSRIDHKAVIRSLPIWQQTQPLVSVMVSPSAAAIRSPAIPMLPKSLTSTAIRRPSACRSTWLSSVVLPEPR